MTPASDDVRAGSDQPKVARARRVLIADDEATTRRLLEAQLNVWGYEVLSTGDGLEAWDILARDSAVQVAIIDWMMPELDGLGLCRRVRAAIFRPVYLIMLTSKTAKINVAQGLDAGADDYITKPFNPTELRARVGVGERMVLLQMELADRVRQLEDALANVKQLQGLVPMCSYCKKIRDDQDYWHRVESYIERHTSAQFSHGVCPDCYEKILKPQLEGT